MLKWYRADLHVHTCLSPCGDLVMSPKRVVKMARARKLDLIAITDHNSCENALAAMRCARGTAVNALPGMEITSAEEVHLIALFDRIEDALAMQGTVYAHLAAGENDPAVFGDQIVANEFDEVEGYNKRMLIGATGLAVAEIIEKIHRLNGLVIASHVDRPSFSIISQLGFIPDDIELDAVELSAGFGTEKPAGPLVDVKKFPVVTASDAHEPGDIGRATTEFFIAEPTIDEIKKALRREEKRTYGINRAIRARVV